MRGELLLRRPGDARATAAGERCPRKAIAVARRRAARSPELRAATELARLWHPRGERERARRLLAPLCRWFTEGNDTTDVRAAQELLAAVEGAARRRLPLLHSKSDPCHKRHMAREERASPFPPIGPSNALNVTANCGAVSRRAATP